MIDEYLRSAGYKPSTADTCIYIKQEGERYVLLAIYVDDILIASNNTSMLQKEKVQLSEKFDVVDQGEAHYILGIPIKRNRSAGTMSLSQPMYIENILKRFKMENCNPVKTPLEPGTK